MIDPFVLLTPVLLLGVIALLRFVGCHLLFNLDELEGVKLKINNVLPTSLTVCGGFTVSGEGFSSSSIVQWNLTPLLTTHPPVSSTELKVDVDLALGDTLLSPAQVTVVNPEGSSSPFTYSFSVTSLVANVVSFGSRPPGVNNNDPVNVFQNIQLPGWKWFTDATSKTAIYFDAVGSARTFMFVNGPRILQIISLRHFTPGLPAITVTVENDKGESAQSPPIPGGQSQILPTGWQQCSQSVTITLDTPSDQVGIVDLKYLGPV